MTIEMAIGKRVVDDLYLHISAIEARLGPDQCAAVHELYAALHPAEDHEPNVVKYNVRDGRVSLLCYPDFDTSPFPRLTASWTRAPGGDVRFRTYADSMNPPILHRKELLVPTGWPQRDRWIETTRLAESLGLFEDPHIIGLLGNWSQLLASRGYEVRGSDLLPIGNDDGVELRAEDSVPARPVVQRHLTALSRSSLSAPVQLLLRCGLLATGTTLFDYGCGKGDDVRELAAAGHAAAGWDPYFAPEEAKLESDIVNLGFVINVIEDPIERADALRGAASLARRALVVSVMLHNSASAGTIYGDGVLSSRGTFQKYFSQDEFRDYLEHALGLSVIMAAPGIGLVFKDREWEQRFLLSRLRRKGVAARLIGTASRMPRAPKPPRTVRVRQLTAQQTRREELKPLLSQLWELSLELGRWPFPDEVPHLQDALGATGGSLTRALRIVERTSDPKLLEAASLCRRDDVLLFLAMQQFSKRPAYKRLDERLQRDIKAFFGTYGAAYGAAAALLRETGSPERLLEACKEAASRGLGYLQEDQSLQLHVSLLDRLPVVLRAYVGCGLVLWDETSAVQVVKVHIASGKLTLLELDDFDRQWLPRLNRRVKINLRRLDYQIFEYGDLQNPRPLLFHKSRYINEEHSNFLEQQRFDEALVRTGVLDGQGEYGPTEVQLNAALELRRLRIGTTGLEPSERIPHLDQPCGRYFSFRSFVECGATQHRLGVHNIPLRPETYNAFYALATQVLDPVVEYFGRIALTYGFCSPMLGKNIKRRVAPKLDQHAGCELNSRGTLICARGGAACDFLVEDESMREVADWIIQNVPFDRLYYYGDNRPLHVSFGPEDSREAYEIRETSTGNALPRRYCSDSK